MCNLCSSKINCGTCDKKDNPDLKIKVQDFPISQIDSDTEIVPKVPLSRRKRAIPPRIVKNVLTVDGKRFHIVSIKRQTNDERKIKVCTREGQIFHLQENRFTKKGRVITYLSLIKQEKDPAVKKLPKKPILTPILLPEELELS